VESEGEDNEIDEELYDAVKADWPSGNESKEEEQEQEHDEELEQMP
jgi:hypothetical protein